MRHQVPEDFQRKVDEWNASHPGPADIAVAWNCKSERWEIWAIPTEMSCAPTARNDQTIRLMRPLPDDSCRMGIKLFSWADWDEYGHDIGFLPLDNRVFDALHWADSFRSKDHFNETVSNPEVEKEVRQKKHIRAVAAGTAQYFHNIPNPMVSMNPAIKAKADWRSAKWKY